MKRDDPEPMKSDDEMYQRLIYLQALDDIIRGTLPLKRDSEVVLLVATAIGIDFMEDFPQAIGQSVQARFLRISFAIMLFLSGGLLESEMMEYIPVPWRSKKSEQKWAEAILSKRSQVLLFFV